MSRRRVFSIRSRSFPGRLALAGLFSVIAAAGYGQNEPGRFGFNLAGCVGFLTAGVVAGADYTDPSGLAGGLDLALTVPSGADPVSGLSGGKPIHAAAAFSGGWDGPVNAPWTVSLRLVLGLETTWLNERVVDPAHGIDRGYSTFDLVADPALRLGVNWYPLVDYGLRAALQLSLLDLRKSLVSLGAAIRLKSR